MFEKIFVIAEIGMNHNGSVTEARAMIDAAAACGADAVKFQCHIFSAESMEDAPAPSYFNKETRKTFFERTAFSPEQWKRLKEHAESKKLEFIVSPFSLEAIGLLEGIGVKIYKVPSGEITNTPYLEALAKTGKPVILSTGMSNWKEIDAAVKTVSKFNKKLALLQCTSLYPCRYEDVGLDVMCRMKERYDIPVGLSDHTATIFASLAAASLGAKIIEKHFTIDKNSDTPDSGFSILPDQMKLLIEGVRSIEKMLLSRVDKDDLSRFNGMKKVFEKSVVSKKFIPKGCVITADLLAFKKPGDGIRADRINDIVGRKAAVDIKENTKIKEEFLQ